MFPVAGRSAAARGFPVSRQLPLYKLAVKTLDPCPRMAKPKQPVVAGKTPPPNGRSAVERSGPAAEGVAAARQKEAITIRLSRDLLSALYHHQAAVRSAGSRKRDTTIGAVVETLLRQALGAAVD